MTPPSRHRLVERAREQEREREREGGRKGREGGGKRLHLGEGGREQGREPASADRFCERVITLIALEEGLLTVYDKGGGFINGL